ncbi:MAG: alanine racemase [Acidimicrobiia bacterium]|nr:alanine racemase [Acidimicrobiia bacterium]MDH3398607.1 alanine racemase [Acidimicrobiia bacterium]
MTFNHATLSRLSESYGDSFFLVHLDRFENNFREFRDELRSHYPSTNLAYSYKTNYLPRFCSIVDTLDGYAEVVSRMEYDLARSINVNPDRIIFNGPYKTSEDIQTALIDGATVNIDGPRQLSLVEEVGPDLPNVGRVGVRVTFDLPGEKPSRFGFPTEELTPVLRRLRRIPNVLVEGIHCHFASSTRGTAVYLEITRRMLDLAGRHFAQTPPQFVDLGGGYFSPMGEQLRRQFSGPVPTYAEYAETIGKEFARRYPAGDGPELILEPGVSVAADAIDFVAMVMEVRYLNGTHQALVSGSIHNIKPTLNKLNLPLTVVEHSTDTRPPPGPIDVVGYTCMEHDILFSGYPGSLQEGDFVVFSNTGAYTNVLQPPFIRPAPPMIGIQEGAPFEILRRGETLEDVLETYAT